MRPKHLWSVVPEVSGVVVNLSPNLRVGLPVRRGDLLFDIDPRPYQLAVKRIRALVHRLEKEVAVLAQQRQNLNNILQLVSNDSTIAEKGLRHDEELALMGHIPARDRDRRRQMHNEAIQAVQNVEHLLSFGRAPDRAGRSGRYGGSCGP